MDYQLHYLGSSKVDQAFPLMQLAIPELTLARWRDFAGKLVVSEPRGGTSLPPQRAIVLAQDSSGYLHGLFSYAVEEDLLGRTLALHDFVVCALFGTEAVADALLARVDALAAALDCAAVRADVPTPMPAHTAGSEVVAQFARRGYRPHGLHLCCVRAQ